MKRTKDSTDDPLDVFSQDILIGTREIIAVGDIDDQY